MIKKDIIETEVRTSGFEKVQRDLAESSKRMDELKEAIKRVEYEKNKLIAAGKKESQEYKNLDKESKQLKNSLVIENAEREKLIGGLRFQEMSYNQLKQRANELKASLKGMSQAAEPERFAKYANELKQCEAQMAKLGIGIKKVSTQMEQAPGVWGNAMGKVKNYLPAIGVGSAISKGVGELTQFFAGAVPAFREYDEALVDAMKTTNQSKKGIISISENLGEIDTRTSQNELLGLARVAGRLGNKGAEDIESFVRSADKINVAITEDLGGNAETAINEIGKLVDIFHLKEEYGIEGSMLRVGSAINEAGAASTANEGYIVEFAKRVAGVAPAADISIQNTIGLAATLDKLGQRAETSSTVYGQVITKMFGDTAKFAGLAKMGVKEFTDLINTDANAAFVQLLKGLKGNSSGMSEIVNNLDDMKVRGAQGLQVMGALVDNIDTLEKQQTLANTAFADGTSILDEFNKKNNSAEAQSEKLAKKFKEQSVILGEVLNPIVNSASTGLLYFVKALVGVVEFLVKSKGAIIGLTASYAGYIAIQKLSAFFSAANGVAIRRTAVAIRAETVALKEGTITAATYTIGEKALIAVKALLAGQFRAATVAARAFWVALGPMGQITAIVGAAATAIGLFGSKTKEATNVYSQFLLEVNKENATYADLKKRLNETTQGTAERADLIKTINEHYKEYLPSLLTEKSTTEEVATALGSANKSMLESINIKIKAAEVERIRQEQFEKEKEIVGKLMDEYTDLGKTPAQIALFGDKLMQFVEKAKSGNLTIEETRRLLVDLGYDFTTAMTVIQSSDNNVARRLRSIYGGFVDVKKGADKASASIDFLGKLLKGQEGNGGKTGSGGGGDKPCSKCGKTHTGECNATPPAAKSKWTVDSDEAFGNARYELKEKLYKNEIKSEEEHNRLLAALEIKTLDDRIKSGKEKGDDLLKLKRELLDKQYTQQKNEQARLTKLQDIANGGESPVEQENIRYDKQRKELELFGVDRENMTADQLSALLVIEKQHTQKLSALHFDALSKDFDKSKKELERSLTELKTKQGEELASVKTFEDKKILLAKYYSDEEVRQITTDKEADKAIKAAFQKQEIEAQRDFLNKSLAVYTGMMAEFESTGTIGGVVFSEEDKRKLDDIIANLKKQLAELGVVINKTPEAGKGKKVDILGMSADDWETMFTNLGDGKNGIEEWGEVIGAVGGAIGQAFSEVSNLMTAIEQKELKQYEKTQNKKKQALDAQLKRGVISQETYNQRVQAIDEQTAAKKEEAERKQAERQKMMAVFQILLNTAMAIMSTSAQLGWPAAIPFVIAIGALGAIQLAAVIAQPLPGAETGGMLVERTQDGHRFNAEFEPQKRGAVSSPTVIVGENGTEYVVPADGYANPTVRPVLDMLERARLSGTLRNMDFTAMWPQASMQGKAKGGHVNDSAKADTTINYTNQSKELADAVKSMTDAANTLTQRLERPIEAVTNVSIAGKGGLAQNLDKYNELKSRSRINSSKNA